MDRTEEILAFWFGSLPTTAAELERRMIVWFGGAEPERQAERDREIRERFGELIERAAAGELAGWAGTPRGRLALILLLDQFPRNVYRGTARAFAYDDAALGLALAGIEAGDDRALDPVERIFFYLPLQHAESREMQRRSVTAYRRLLLEAPLELQAQFAETLGFAEEHRAVVERFGRFPHRNRALGRESTAEERDYLQSADSYGQ